MRCIARTLGVICLCTGAANAADFDLPDQVSWTVLESLGQQQAAAIGDALREAAGVALKIVPGDSDAARAEMLRNGEVDFVAAAVGGSIAAQEGVFGFDAKDLGPQKVRLVLANTEEPINYEIAVAGDLGVRTFADLKGKRVAWYVNYPVVNVNTEAYLAYGGLTWDDVERVEVKGFFDAALKALADGELDAAFAATIGTGASEADAGPRDLFWPPVDPSDREAMARMAAVAPYFVPHVDDEGPGIEPGTDQHGAHYPYPILVTMAATSDDLVINMVKAMVELFPQYKGKVLGIDGWEIDEQELLWFVPYHAGAVDYFKEAGLWTDRAQANNDRLIARQDALADAWTALKAENPDNWKNTWAARRAQALKDGGFQPLF